MSRGPGVIQQWLADRIIHSPDPMTFDQILAAAYPEGGFVGDMAKTLGKSNVGATRSLRRALRRLCDVGPIMRIGEGGRGDPYRYWVNPMVLALNGNKARYDEVCNRLGGDPALTAAANAACKRLMG